MEGKPSDEEDKGHDGEDDDAIDEEATEDGGHVGSKWCGRQG